MSSLTRFFYPHVFHVLFCCTMAREILVYYAIYSWTAEDFVKQMEEARGQDVVVRLNTPGGGVQEGWAMLAKFSEHPKRKLVKVDGHADSMGLFFLAYADDVEATDVATFILHRAAYSSYYEGNAEFMTQEVWDDLKRTNDKLRAALESKIDAAKFLTVTGYTLDQVFSTPGRLEVKLTAEQALEVGLINRINQLTPEKKAELAGTYLRIAAQITGAQQPAIAASTTTKKPNMNLAELKAAHPDLCAQLVNEGVTQERDRVEACLVFLEVDPKGVKAAIESGKPLTAKQMAEFALKQTSPEAVAKLRAESAPVTNTEEPAGEKDAETKEVEAFAAQIDKSLGLKK